MSGYTFFQYLKIKIRVSLLRLLFNVVKLFTKRRVAVDPSVAFSKLRIPSRDAGRKIEVHVYRPKEIGEKERTPVLINMHGSGYILPSLGWDREFCSLVAARVKIPVLDADYRKAPEYPFPAAHADFEDVLAYVRAQTHLYDPARILLSGFSAGAVITLTGSSLDTLSLASRYAPPLTPPPRIRGVISFYPNVDRTAYIPPPDKLDLKAGHAGAVLSLGILRLFGAAYLPPGSPPPTDPRLSPRFAPPGSFPQFMYMACGSADAFFVAGRDFFASLEGTRVVEEGEGEGEGPERVARFMGLKGEGHGYDKSAKKGSVAERHLNESYADALEMTSLAIA